MDKEIHIGLFKSVMVNFMCHLKRVLLDEINIQIGKI